MTARQIVGGLGWSAAAMGTSALCQLFFVAVLARQLDPVAFGLMAMAAIALRFASFFAHMGFAQALIQRETLSAEDTTAALVMSLAISLGLCLVLMLVAPLFAVAFRATALSALLRALAWSLVLGAVGSLPLALLRRQARFRRVNTVEVVGYVVGYGGVGIACAYGGWGVWSLVAATLSQQALTLALALSLQRYPLAWPVPRAAYAQLWSYGARHSVIGFLEFLWGNVEPIFIGRRLGTGDLGLYNRATMLTNMPVELGVNAMTKVLFPALSGLQTEQARMADGFRMLLLGIGLVSTAIACGVAAAAPDVVALLLGARWAGITPLVEVVALAVPPMFLFVACGITLDSLAALRPKLRLQACMLPLKVALVLLGAHWGMVGIAWAAVSAEVIRLGFGLRLLSGLLAIPFMQLGCQLALVLLTGTAVAAVVRLAAMLAVLVGASLGLRVVGEAAAGMLAVCASVALVLLSFPHYAPVQRFDPIRRWHARALRALRQDAWQT